MAEKPAAPKDDMFIPPFLFQPARMTEVRSILDILPEKPAFLTPPPPIPEDEIQETLTADVIVVGEGFAALCCALRARQTGADTLIVTASKKPVGRGGSVFAAYSKYMAEKGVPRPDLDKFLLEEMEARSFLVDQRKYYRFINRSEEAMDWLIDILRAHGITIVSENVNIDDPDSPTYMPPGTHGFSVEGQGHAGVGISLALGALEEEFLASGGRIVRGTPAKQLEKDGARVCAVLAQKPDGSYLRAKAARGVVLATGDFSRNREMMDVYCPQYADGFAPEKPDYDIGF